MSDDHEQHSFKCQLTKHNHWLGWPIVVKGSAVVPIETFPPSSLAGWAGWLAGWLGAAGQVMLSWLKVVLWAL